jgi:outer membrane protein OmpA-like peptidoglycan-associated protein
MIEAPMAPGGQTRGFKPARPGGDAAQKSGPGKASLLITFPTDSAEITAETKVTLDTLARAVQSDALAGFSFSVEGHADARGDAGHNQQLSLMRAEAVVGYVIAQHGILAERLTPVGKGSSEPLNKARIDGSDIATSHRERGAARRTRGCFPRIREKFSAAARPGV